MSIYMVDLDTISWDHVIGRDTRGTRHADDLGAVQEVARHYIMTEKGIVNKEKWYLPKYLVHGFDGQ